MAGSPIKRARRLGLVPPAPPKSRARGRAILNDPLPPDPQIALDAKKVLYGLLMSGSILPGARATAARILLEATKGSSASTGLERLSDEQVAQLSVTASVSVSLAPPLPPATSIEAGEVPDPKEEE